MRPSVWLLDGDEIADPSVVRIAVIMDTVTLGQIRWGRVVGQSVMAIGLCLR
jgi:hypothetical protein